MVMVNNSYIYTWTNSILINTNNIKFEINVS